MNQNEIAALLEKAVSSMVEKEVPKQDSNLESAIVELTKAVTAINSKVDALATEVVLKEKPETAEQKIEKLAAMVAELTKKLEEKAAAASKEEGDEEGAEGEDEEASVEKVAAALLAKMGVSTEDATELKGESKDASELQTLIKALTAKTASSVSEEDVSGIETVDSNGNPLTKQQIIGRKNLDSFFGKQLESFSAQRGYGKNVAAANDDDDGDE